MGHKAGSEELIPDAPVPLVERMKDDIGLDVYDEDGRLIYSSEEEPDAGPSKDVSAS